MNAQEARRITDDANRPYTLAEVLDGIKTVAKWGCEKSSGWQARRMPVEIVTELTSRGFTVTLQNVDLVTIAW